MTVTEARATSARLLASVGPGGRRADLGAHRATHGDPFPVDRRQLLGELARSGLTGRGGGGFPTASKLDTYRRHRVAVLAVNATEGEPASRKDTTLLALVPHLVLDGAQLAARLAGAPTVAVCVHQGSPARASLAAALNERRRVLTDVTTEVVELPARYVAGEESALSNFLMTGRSLPVHHRSKSVPLVFGRDGIVLVQNAETLAQLTLVAFRGADWFREGGLDGVGGTRLVTISGAVSRPGVYEISTGTSLGAVLDLAAPAPALSGILVGGFGGTFVESAQTVLPYSAAGLAPAGAHPGAGVLLALPGGTCALAEVARIARYMARESAGQCGPCVFGLPAIASDFERLARGEAETADVDRLRGRLASVAGRGGCRHPDGVVRMVRSALQVFEADVREHASGRGCIETAPRSARSGAAR